MSRGRRAILTPLPMAKLRSECAGALPLDAPVSSLPPTCCCTAPAGEQAELLPGHAEVESVLGVSLAGVENMEKSVRQILNNDTSAISTLRCLKLYLERLGCDFGDGQQLQRAAGGQGWPPGRGAASVGTALWGWHTITSWGAKGSP